MAAPTMTRVKPGRCHPAQLRPDACDTGQDQARSGGTAHDISLEVDDRLGWHGVWIVGIDNNAKRVAMVDRKHGKRAVVG